MKEGNYKIACNLHSLTGAIILLIITIIIAEKRTSHQEGRLMGKSVKEQNGRVGE